MVRRATANSKFASTTTRLTQRCFATSSSSRPRRRNNKEEGHFGIVAAVSTNGIIGVNGSLPWRHLPQDRAQFVHLTRGKVLILGRKTFFEDPSGRHIAHARTVIVVSKTLTTSPAKNGRADDASSKAVEVKLARSFQEALNMAAQEAQEAKEAPYCNVLAANDKSILGEAAAAAAATSGQCFLDCWVAGGERIYEMALRHPLARELHLTRVHTTVDINHPTTENLPAMVSYFPHDSVWRHRFRQVSRLDSGEVCTFFLYRNVNTCNIYQ